MKQSLCLIKVLPILLLLHLVLKAHRGSSGNNTLVADTRVAGTVYNVVS